jgi:hypothetical protein
MIINKKISINKLFFFISKYKSFSSILADNELASLGDAYGNLLYSLVLSRKKGKPIGKKLKNSLLASALKKADLRRYMPSRTDNYKQADAAEALIIYGWVTRIVNLDEAINIIEKEKTIEEGFSKLMYITSKRLSERNLKH